MKTALHERDREFNVVMFNVDEETENGNSSIDFNNEVAIDVMRCTGLTGIGGVFSTERIGVAKTGKIRPLKVKFENKAAAFHLLSCSKYLKDDETYFSVFIEPDRCREQRIAHRKLVQQLKAKRNSDASGIIFGIILFVLVHWNDQFFRVLIFRFLFVIIILIAFLNFKYILNSILIIVHVVVSL